MRALDVTWWPDLVWPGSEIFTTYAEKMYDKVCQKRRRYVFKLFTKKPHGVVFKHPPSGARVNIDLWPGLDLTCDLFEQKCYAQKIDLVRAFNVVFPVFLWPTVRKLKKGQQNLPLPSGARMAELSSTPLWTQLARLRWGFSVPWWGWAELGSSSWRAYSHDSWEQWDDNWSQTEEVRVLTLSIGMR